MKAVADWITPAVGAVVLVPVMLLVGFREQVRSVAWVGSKQSAVLSKQCRDGEDRSAVHGVNCP